MELQIKDDILLIVRSSPLQKAAVAPFALYFHSPPPLTDIHPPPAIDSAVDVESYFQDFIPSDDSYIVDQSFSL
jgi:hypothetical protein